MKKSNPKTSSDNYDVVVVGAGFSGMYLVKKLRDLGLNFVILEQGGDVGGTWYWNRYPGARCDIPTVEYSYSFDKELEQSWDWQELMAAQPEILTYANQVADNYDLRDAMRFNTRVASADFDENENSWTVVTDTGDEYLARYFIMATGCLSVPNWPDIEGREDYAGRTIHTGLWPHEKVDFTGLRVGIIGTGSSAVQSIPEIAKTAKELKVFQRTPVYTFPAGNHPLDDDFRADIKARYEDIRETQRGSLGGMAMFGVMGRLQEVGTEKIADCSEEEREQRSPKWIAPIVTWLASAESKDITGRVFEASGQVLAIAEGWHRGPTHAPVEDPTALGPIVEELMSKARLNAGMDGRDGTWPQPQKK